MAASTEICDAQRWNYKDINEILDVVLGDSDEDIVLEEIVIIMMAVTGNTKLNIHNLQ